MGGRRGGGEEKKVEQPRLYLIAHYCVTIQLVPHGRRAHQIRISASTAGLLILARLAFLCACFLSFITRSPPPRGYCRLDRQTAHPRSWLCACRCAHAPGRPESTPPGPAGGGSGGRAAEGWDARAVSSASRRRRASHVVVVYQTDESHTVPRTQLHLSEYLLVTRFANAARQGFRAGLSALAVLL